MDQHTSHVSTDEIEEALGQVSDIQAVRVVACPDGHIQEVHVLALQTKSPKQLVRDIESTLMARFGVPIDHKKISIAQLGPDIAATALQAQPEEIPSATRAKVHAINMTVSGSRADVKVTLEIAGKVYVGEAAGSASQTSRQRIVAQATLNAVNAFAKGVYTFSLEDVAVARFGREEVAVSCVMLESPLGDQMFAGSAMVRQNEKDSIVRATLDAINRRVGFLTTT